MTIRDRSDDTSTAPGPVRSAAVVRAGRAVRAAGDALARPEATAAAYALTLGSLVLTNSLNAPQVLFLAVLLPLVGLRVGGLAATPEGAAALRMLPRAVVLGAVAAYVAMLIVATAVQPDATLRLVRRTLQYGVEIVAFVAATALVTATSPLFLRLLVIGLSAAVATSALVNMAAFGLTLPDQTDALLTWRLVAVLGTPEYANSTNIGLTYGIALVAAAAAMAGPARSRLAVAVLAPSSAVLALAALLTQARGTVVGIACGLATLAATQSRRTRIAVVTGGALILGALAVTPLGPNWIERGASRRPEVWHAFLAKAAERPLLGWGGHTDITVVIASGVPIDQPHNLVLSGLVRGGGGAALAMLAILAAGLYWSIRHLRAGGTPVPLCALVTMTVSGMVDYNLLITRPAWPWLTFWLPIGLAAGAEIAVRAKRDAPGAPAGRAPPPG